MDGAGRWYALTSPITFPSFPFPKESEGKEGPEDEMVGARMAGK